jgi:hypothetical protein
MQQETSTSRGHVPEAVPTRRLVGQLDVDRAGFLALAAVLSAGPGCTPFLVVNGQAQAAREPSQPALSAAAPGQSSRLLSPSAEGVGPITASPPNGTPSVDAIATDAARTCLFVEVDTANPDWTWRLHAELEGAKLREFDAEASFPGSPGQLTLCAATELRLNQPVVARVDMPDGETCRRAIPGSEPTLVMVTLREGGLEVDGTRAGYGKRTLPCFEMGSGSAEGGLFAAAQCEYQYVNPEDPSFATKVVLDIAHGSVIDGLYLSTMPRVLSQERLFALSTIITTGDWADIYFIDQGPASPRAEVRVIKMRRAGSAIEVDPGHGMSQIRAECKAK